LCKEETQKSRYETSQRLNIGKWKKTNPNERGCKASISSMLQFFEEMLAELIALVCDQ
jgi:hypothetical protein